MVYFVEGRPSRQPFLRAPASVIGLIAALAAAHLIRIVLPAALSDRIVDTFALAPLRYAGDWSLDPPSLWQKLAPVFGHMFLHANLTHVAMNCLWLLAFGPVVARRFGSVAFVVFFFLTGLAGAACFIGLAWGQNVAAIGASGAISGLMGAAIRMMRVRDPYLNVASLQLLPLWSSQVLLFSAVWLALNFLTGLIGFGLTGSLQAIAWQDHMGGYLAGLLLAGPFDQIAGLPARIRRARA